LLQTKVDFTILHDCASARCLSLRRVVADCTRTCPRVFSQLRGPRLESALALAPDAPSPRFVAECARGEVEAKPSLCAGVEPAGRVPGVAKRHAQLRGGCDSSSSGSQLRLLNRSARGIPPAAGLQQAPKLRHRPGGKVGRAGWRGRRGCGREVVVISKHVAPRWLWLAQRRPLCEWLILLIREHVRWRRCRCAEGARVPLEGLFAE